ncbi:hypothetical protein OAF14_01685, partial [Akkermansiaceae bacterium]|nr:hypothetical protein [Akkermansiaceae bacterium]
GGVPMVTFSFIARRKAAIDRKAGRQVETNSIHLGYPYLFLVMIAAGMGVGSLRWVETIDFRYPVGVVILFGWKAVVGIVISNALYFSIFKKEFKTMGYKENRDTHMPASWVEREDPIPAWITIVHLLFLAFTVLTAHYQMVFIFGFLFFIGFTQATGHHQNDVNMKSPILVGFFLALAR